MSKRVLIKEGEGQTHTVSGTAILTWEIAQSDMDELEYTDPVQFIKDCVGSYGATIHDYGELRLEDTCWEKEPIYGRRSSQSY